MGGRDIGRGPYQLAIVASAGVLAGLDPIGISVSSDAAAVIAASDAIVDFTVPKASVEFARFEQGVCYLNLTEVARCLPARSLQQVEYFPIHLDRSARGDEYDETQEAGVQAKRDH